MKKDKTKNSETEINASAENEVSSAEIESELRQPIWSVISFERCVAKDLTYAQAAEKIAELEKQNVSGLCVVTNRVVEKIANQCPPENVN